MQARLGEIVRQKDSSLKEALEQLVDAVDGMIGDPSQYLA